MTEYDLSAMTAKYIAPVLSIENVESFIQRWGKNFRLVEMVPVRRIIKATDTTEEQVTHFMVIMEKREE